LTKDALSRALTDTAIGTATIFVIAISASMFASFMGLSTVPTQFAEQILSVVENPVSIIIALSIIFIVLGMFLDGISLLLLTTPIMLPILKSAGIDMIWFGIIAIKLIEIGLITPPVGINIYVIKSVMGRAVPLGAIFRGAFWFIAMDILTLGILIAFPVVTLFLPGLMR
ncbi:MAG: TRAP transporter large permease subunit, partial [Pseudomonadota bacterium]